MNKNLMLESILNSFSTWNETMDVLEEMQLYIGGMIGDNLGRYLPISLMDSICVCLDGGIEDKDEKDEETDEMISVRYYTFSNSTYRIDDAIKIVIESINASESSEECAEKIIKIFI